MKHGHHENNRCYSNSSSSKICISMVADTIVMWFVSVCQKKKKKTLQINGHKRSKIVLSIKTGDKLGGSLKKDASYWIFVLFYFLNFNIYRLMMCLKSVQIYTPL